MDDRSLSVNALPLSEFIAKIPQAKVAKVLSIILAIYIAYLCAQLTWQFFVPSVKTVNTQQQTVVTKQSSQQAVNLNQLTSLHLFGEAKKVKKTVEKTVQNAPQTRLKLTLSGVVASSDALFAAAIIEYQGNQETYGIGDKITGTRASLSQVYPDRVIIKLSGRLETLMLDGVDYKQSVTVLNDAKQDQSKAAANTLRKTSNKTNTSKVVDNRKKLTVMNNTRDVKQAISSDPSKITDYLKISQNRQQGKVVGYRLLPGKDPQFFQSSGLKSGDIAKQINGLDLTNPAEAAKALAVLRSEQEISLLVDRNGELTEILFSIEN